MTEPKRAKDVQVGDVLPDGSKVYHVSKSARGYNIYVRLADGSRKRMQYAAQTIMPAPGEHPSQFAQGHPWDRKSRSSRANI